MANNKTSSSFFGILSRYLAGDFTSIFLSLVVQFVLVKSLTIEDYGIWGLFLASCAIVEGLFSPRLEYAFTRYFTDKIKNKEEFHYIYSLNSYCYLIPTLLLLMSGLIIWFMDFNSMNHLGILISMAAVRIWSKSIEPLWFSVLRDLNKISLIAFFEFLNSFLTLLFVLLLLQFKTLDISKLVLGSSLILLIIYSIKYILTYKVMQKSHSLKISTFNFSITQFNSSQYSELRKYLFSIYKGFVFSSVLRNSDRIILGSILGLTDVGLYNLAKNINEKLIRLIQPLTRIIFYNFSTWSQEESLSKIKKDIFKKLKKWTPYLLPTLILVGLTISFSIPFIFGEKYSTSSTLFLILYLQFILMLFLFWMKPFLLSYGLEDAYQSVELKSVVIFFILSISFAYFFGLFGLTIAVPLTYCIRFTMLYKHLKKAEAS